MDQSPSPARARPAALACALLAAACARPPLPEDLRAPGRSTAAAGAPDAAPARAEAPPSPAPLVELPVPQHLPAVVAVPRGEGGPRPVLVAAHGAGDRAEWQCAFWRDLVGDRGFVLCPRGLSMDRRDPDAGYFYRHHHALGREIALALEALAARFPGRADTAAPAFAGYSQGATFGAALLPRHPAMFSRAALIEGGHGSSQEWSVPAAQAFRRRGGARVLLACGGSGCAMRAKETARLLVRGGLEARVLHVEGAGHTYGGAMERPLREAFGWLVEGDPRWVAHPTGGRMR
jgi:predicted esterase